ncbi:hypothetical protein N7519_004647 [Penicillium mononematosum]|uniref:uncharacterized protein n=1 Tax=Penicillium mononematosum TaxID=268346 RepID=UPI0025486F29|nr:uncharacterized protein N7519_004647 [Penicillium mononematosum]KAJ6189739.1 hypothetical protein N7519_004647 [Penicillium mononematosum]
MRDSAILRLEAFQVTITEVTQHNIQNTTTTSANCAPMTPTGSPPKEIYLFWAFLQRKYDPPKGGTHAGCNGTSFCVRRCSSLHPLFHQTPQVPEGREPLVFGRGQGTVEPFRARTNSTCSLPDTAGTPGAFKTSQSHASLQAIEEMEGHGKMLAKSLSCSGHE